MADPLALDERPSLEDRRNPEFWHARALEAIRRGEEEAERTRTAWETVETEILAMDDLVTAAEVAELAGIKVASVYRYLQRHSMPEPMRLGRTLVWPRVVVEEWVVHRRRKPRMAA